MADVTSRLRLVVDSTGARTATRDLNSVSGAAAGAEAATTRLRNAMLTLVGAFSAVAIVREVGKIVDSYRMLQNQLKLVTNSAAQLQQVQAALLPVANTTGASLENTSKLYANLQRYAGQFIKSQQDALDFVKAVNQSALVSGATIEETNRATIQLIQSIAKGRMQTQDYRFMVEQLPRLAQAMANGMGLTLNELYSVVQKSGIPIQNIIAAVRSQYKELGVEASRITFTIAQSWQILQNSLMQFLGSNLGGLQTAVASTLRYIGTHLPQIAQALETATAAAAAYWAAMAGPSVLRMLSTALTAARAYAATLAAIPAAAAWQRGMAVSTASWGTAAVAPIGKLESAFMILKRVIADAGAALLAFVGGPIGAIALGVAGAVAAIIHFRNEIAASITGVYDWRIALQAALQVLRQDYNATIGVAVRIAGTALDQFGALWDRLVVQPIEREYDVIKLTLKINGIDLDKFGDWWNANIAPLWGVVGKIQNALTGLALGGLPGMLIGAQRDQISAAAQALEQQKSFANTIAAAQDAVQSREAKGLQQAGLATGFISPASIVQPAYISKAQDAVAATNALADAYAKGQKAGEIYSAEMKIVGNDTLKLSDQTHQLAIETVNANERLKSIQSTAGIKNQVAALKELSTQYAQSKDAGEVYAEALKLVGNNVNLVTPAISKLAKAIVDANRDAKGAQLARTIDDQVKGLSDLAAAATTSAHAFDLMQAKQQLIDQQFSTDASTLNEYAQKMVQVKEATQLYAQQADRLRQLEIGPMDAGAIAQFEQNLADAAVNFWTDFRQKGFTAFDDIGSYVKNVFKQLLNDIVGQLFLRPVIQSIVGSFGLGGIGAGTSAMGGMGLLGLLGGGAALTGTSAALAASGAQVWNPATGSYVSHGGGSSLLGGAGLLGSIGSLLNPLGPTGIVTKIQYGLSNLTQTLTGGIDKLFGTNLSASGGLISGLLGGAAGGLGVSSLLGLFGMQQNTGSMIGGALGGAAGSWALGSTLGSIVPGAGTIIGGLLGSLVGGLFGGDKNYPRFGSTFSLKNGQLGYSQNLLDSYSGQSANQFAGAIVQGVSAAVQQLGGALTGTIKNVYLAGYAQHYGATEVATGYFGTPGTTPSTHATEQGWRTLQQFTNPAWGYGYIGMGGKAPIQGVSDPTTAANQIVASMLGRLVSTGNVSGISKSLGSVISAMAAAGTSIDNIVSTVQKLNQVLTPASEQMTQLQQSLQSVTETFSPLIAQMKGLGSAGAGALKSLRDAQKAAINAVGTNYLSNINSQILSAQSQMASQFQQVLDANASRLKDVQALTAAGASNAGKVASAVDQLNSLNLKTFADQLAAASASIDDINKSLDVLNKSSLTAAQKTQAMADLASGFNSNIANQIQQYVTGPVDQLEALLEKEKARYEAAQKIGANLDQVNRLTALEQQNFFKGLSQDAVNQVSSFLGVFQQASATIQQNLDLSQQDLQSRVSTAGQQAQAFSDLTSSFKQQYSGASPRQTISQIMATASDQLASLKGGNLDAAQSLQTTLKNLVQTGQQTYGSTEQFRSILTFAEDISNQAQQASLNVQTDAQRQIDALDTSNKLLTDIKDILQSAQGTNALFSAVINGGVATSDQLLKLIQSGVGLTPAAANDNGSTISITGLIGQSVAPTISPLVDSLGKFTTQLADLPSLQKLTIDAVDRNAASVVTAINSLAAYLDRLEILSKRQLAELEQISGISQQAA